MMGLAFFEARYPAVTELSGVTHEMAAAFLASEFARPNDEIAKTKAITRRLELLPMRAARNVRPLVQSRGIFAQRRTHR